MRILCDRGNPSLAGTTSDVEIGHHSFVDQHEACAFSGNPKAAKAVFKQLHDGTAAQARSIGFVESREPGAIESRQAIDRPQPQITIAALGECDDGALWQPLLRVPDFNTEVGAPRGSAGLKPKKPEPCQNQGPPSLHDSGSARAGSAGSLGSQLAHPEQGRKPMRS